MQLRRAPKIRPVTTAVRHLRVGYLIKSHEVSHDQYADDTQLFLAIKGFLYQRRPSQVRVLFPGGQRVVRRQQSDAQCRQIGRDFYWDISPVPRRRTYFRDCGRRRETEARGSNQVTWRYPGQSFDFCCSCYSCVQGL